LLRPRLVGLASELNRDLWVGEDVVVPVWVCRRSTFGGEDEDTVALAQIHHGIRAALAALGAGRREQEQGPTFPHATDLAVVRPELLDYLTIPVIPICHGYSSHQSDAGLVSRPVA
jgi:hypothetical protein